RVAGKLSRPGLWTAVRSYPGGRYRRRRHPRACRRRAVRIERAPSDRQPAARADRHGSALRRRCGARPRSDAAGQGGACREPDRSRHAVCALASGGGHHPRRPGDDTTVRGRARRRRERPVAARRARPVESAAPGLRRRTAVIEMRRRQFITLVGGAAAGLAVTSEANGQRDSEVEQSGQGRYARALQAAKRDYKKISKPSEAARSDYITRLVRMREKAARLKTDEWQAIDAEIKRHPAPDDSDSKKLSSLLVGEWKSPPHDYL